MITIPILLFSIETIITTGLIGGIIGTLIIKILLKIRKRRNNK